MKNFALDKKTNVYLKYGNASDFGYADGAEDSLLKIVSEMRQRGKPLDEYPFSSWAEEYHLSSLRGNILYSFLDSIKQNGRILELGCGCGAITEKFAELGFTVDAVEGSFDRAKVAAKRCQHFKNVNVFCSNFSEIEPTVDYDVITLIGVFEYSPLYWPSQNPLEDCLKFIRQIAKKQTKVIIAIENKIGLKYFNSHGEDHMGIRYFGLNDLYQVHRPTPETFTRKKLIDLVKSNLEISDTKTITAYPDYKLPSIFISEAGHSDKKVKIGSLLNNAISRDYLADNQVSFNEAATNSVLKDAAVSIDFANSFIIIASWEPMINSEWLAKILASHRNREYRTVGTIKKESNGYYVEKRYQFNCNLDNSGLFIHSIIDKSEYIAAETVGYYINRALHQPDDFKYITSQFLFWIDFLKRLKNNNDEIPGKYFDLLPRNTLLTNANTYQIIDMEWIYKNNISLQFIVMRGIVDVFMTTPSNFWKKELKHINLRSYIKSVCKKAKINYTTKEEFKYFSIVASFYTQVLPNTNRNSIVIKKICEIYVPMSVTITISAIVKLIKKVSNRLYK